MSVPAPPPPLPLRRLVLRVDSPFVDPTAVLLLEAALAQLPTVVVRVEGLPEPPGWAWAWGEGARRLDGQVALRPDRIDLRLCDDAGDCVVLGAEDGGARARAREISDRAGAWLKLSAPSLRAGPVSESAVALREFGRAARDAFRGRRPYAGLRWERLDRAVRADPGFGEAWSLLGRRAAEAGDLEVASATLGHALDLGAPPADAAAVWIAAGQPERVLRLGRRLADPRDPRMATLLAVAPCVQGPGVAPRFEAGCLAALPAAVRESPAVLRLQGQGTPAPAARLELLAAWARADDSPEPAEAARDLALETQQWARALALDEVVGAKGGRRLGDEGRLRLEHALRTAEESAAAREAATKEGRSPAIRVARARLALESGEVRTALALADERLAESPHDADALAVRARALAELGRNHEAGEALFALDAVDPMAPDATLVRRLLRGR